MRDLFEFYTEQPKELAVITEKWAEKMADGIGYDGCRKFLTEVGVVGYTFEYGLDAEPFNLRKKPAYLFLESVGTWIDKSTLVTYADTDDPDNGVVLNQVCNEWIAKLSPRDLQTIISI